MGLREDKKEATRRRLIMTALDLFEARGFDNVSVAEIAEATEVSKMTVFNYFQAKEDLISGTGKHHIHEPATVVRERPVGQTPRGAILDFFLKSMTERQPFTGLSDDPDDLRVERLVSETPALLARRLQYRHESERLLAEALVEESSSHFTARVMAAQIHATQEVVIDENRRRILGGESADDVYPDAVQYAKHAFHRLQVGLGDTFRRRPPGSAATTPARHDRPDWADRSRGSTGARTIGKASQQPPHQTSPTRSKPTATAKKTRGAK
jgi:AcrR family transcriptional regulator